MTLDASRDSERVKQRLQERSEKFQQEFHNLKIPEEAFGIRLTALPVGEGGRFDNASQLHKLFIGPFVGPREGSVQLPWKPVTKKVKTNGSNESKEEPRQLVDLSSDYSNSMADWQLDLRRIRRQFNQPSKNDQPEENWKFDYREIHCDGLLEFGHIACNHVFGEGQEFPVPFSSDWSLILLANLASWVDCIKCKASAPKAEYRIEIEIQRRGEREVQVETIKASIYHGAVRAYDMPAGDGVKFPNYSLEEPHAALLLKFYRDFWNWLGRHGEEYDRGNAEIEFEIG